MSSTVKRKAKGESHTKPHNIIRCVFQTWKIVDMRYHADFKFPARALSKVRWQKLASYTNYY